METTCPNARRRTVPYRGTTRAHSEPTTGIVFDIREFTVHDGPGLRTTVFVKGCPLRCAWCHNPEGLAHQPQIMRSTAGSRTAGQSFRADELAERLNRQAPILRDTGGVTFSGGEPLQQARFVADVVCRLDRLHVAIESCGYGSASAFRSLIRGADLVLFGLKLADPIAHERWTGLNNAPILRNLRLLSDLRKPFVIRIPLIPGVTDTRSNLCAIASLIRPLPGLAGVELLPYNRAAGAKYAACGLNWNPGFDETNTSAPDLSCFDRYPVEVRVL